MPKAIIVGSGIAGIATSIRLCAKGYEVEVYERNDYPGGKLTSINKDGFRFDAGPSLFTLPHLVTELFELFGEDRKDYFQYEQCTTICNYFWEDGTKFKMKSDVDQSISEMSRLFDDGEKALRKYIESSKRKYDLTASIFLEQSLHSWKTYFSLNTLKTLLQSMGLGLFESLDSWNSKRLRDKRLVQLFNRYATYNGSSPYKTPGIMSMIPHLEMNLGTFFPKGGMIQITNALVLLAERHGVRFRYGEKVEEIVVENRQAIGVKVGGSMIKGDVVVSNMDVFSSYRSLLKNEKAPERILRQERSSSALIFYWGISEEFPELDLHNILFAKNYKKEFEAIFDLKEAYSDPTIYINISSKKDKSSAPSGKENWFVMVNMPSNTGQDWDSIIKRTRENILRKIERILSKKIEGLIETESIMDPRQIESRTSSHQGALYGTASNNRYSAFLRHSNFSSVIENLYFCGGSVHPGGGIPLCLNSAKIVSNFIV